MSKTRVVATGAAAFGAKWELGQDGGGQWAIAREFGGRTRTQYFDNETDARAYFAQYTTPVVAVEVAS